MGGLKLQERNEQRQPLAAGSRHWAGTAWLDESTLTRETNAYVSRFRKQAAGKFEKRVSKASLFSAHFARSRALNEGTGFHCLSTTRT